MNIILKINDVLNKIVWGSAMQFFLLGTGLLLAILSHGIIYRKFKFILKNTFGKIFEKVEAKEGHITPFQAVSTALAATVGTGNIAGVTLAISAGGPGAVFWVWLAAVFGMTTKVAEVTLAVATRTTNVRGEKVGGPMYYMERGLKCKPLAVIFAVFGSLACFGIGCMTQANSISQVMGESFSISPSAVGIVLCILLAMVILGGVKRIGIVAEKIVPLMSALYILGGIAVLIINYRALPESFALIFKSAFTKTAAVGGFAGAGVASAIKNGLAKGIFTNEAGLGSAPIAHASSNIDHPVRQGIWGAFEVFVDTILVCSITALVVISSGMWTSDKYQGASLTMKAFGKSLPHGELIVTIGLMLFAFTTILGWSYYGEKCIEYLFGNSSIKFYRIIFVLAAYVGAIGGLSQVWKITDTLNGMMAIPNLIALIALRRPFVRLVNDFFQNPDKIRSENEDFMRFFED